jgi:hypothetical protein
VTAGMLYTIQLIESLNLNSFYGQHAVYELYTLLIFCIGIFEIRYIAQKVPAPRLTWFYDAYVQHEMQQFWLNWQDTLEENSRPFLAVSKEQIDYYLIHKEFVYIKKRSLSNYLDNEKKNLEKHFYERTVTMLKSIENMENNNVKHKIKALTEEAVKVVLDKTASKEGRKALHQSSFQSALNGLRSGKMTYAGDSLLPLFVEEINKRIDPLKKLTATEESKLFSLSADQRRQLMDNDHRAKIEYLATPPDVTSAGVKNNDTYKNIITRMKSRIEASFKH